MLPHDLVVLAVDGHIFCMSWKVDKAAGLWLWLGGVVGAAPSFGLALVVVIHALDPDILLFLLFEGGEVAAVHIHIFPRDILHTRMNYISTL